MAKINYLSKVIHINASPEFFNDKEAMKILEKMVKKAYHMPIKDLKKIKTKKN